MRTASAAIANTGSSSENASSQRSDHSGLLIWPSPPSRSIALTMYSHEKFGVEELLSHVPLGWVLTCGMAATHAAASTTDAATGTISRTTRRGK